VSAIPLVPENTQPLPRLGSPEGLLSWVASVDHKRIGIMYLVTTFGFFCLGGLEALLMRWQLAQPRSTILTASDYDQIFTMHGVTMIFLVVMPALFGFSLYFVPLMIGANEIAFPRLNALGYWTLIFGGLMLYFSPLAGGAPDKGWFAYAPLTEKNFSLNTGMDFYVVGLLTTGIGSVATAVNLIVTIFTMRAPGMSLKRVPLFVWMVLINSFLVVLALPSLNASLVTLMIDRQLMAHFFDPSAGGQPILWQHMFWSFGHPEVYIMVLPAWGMISEVLPVFSRKPLFGYGFVAGSTVAILFLSLLVWGHHMFTVGMGPQLDALFGLASMMIAVPTGIKIFNWLATCWGGAIRFTTAMLFALAFIPLFTLGGITGVSFAAVPVDWQVEDTYYVVAHMHYVLFGGTAFALFAATYYWFPKMSGRMLSEGLGRWHFWLTFIGFNLTFFPQHFLGLMGMPRRVYTYPDLPGWGALNLMSSLGAAILGVSVLIFLWNLLYSVRSGEVAAANPWDAWSLEWLTASPASYHNFKLVPPIRSRRPLWDLNHPELQRGSDVSHGAQRALAPAGSRPRNVFQEQLRARFDQAPLGVLLFLLTESVFFILLIFTFAFYRMAPANGSGPNVHTPDVHDMVVFTGCLWLSSLTIWLAGWALRRGNHRLVGPFILATMLLGVTFLAGEAKEWLDFFHRNITASRDVFATAFFTLTGFHGLHVFVGLCLLLILLLLTLGGVFKRSGGQPSLPGGFEAISYYWHFVDIVWVAVFSVVYLWPLVS